MLISILEFFFVIVFVLEVIFRGVDFMRYRPLSCSLSGFY